MNTRRIYQSNAFSMRAPIRRRWRDKLTVSKRCRASRRPGAATAGFSLLELLISVVIITVVMGTVFEFMAQAQKRYQGNQVTTESNQDARSAMEIMTQEIGQAGNNPNFSINGYAPTFTANKSLSAAISTAQAQLQCAGLAPDISQINPGDWLSIDTGANAEMVQVISTSAVSGSPCSGSNQIQAVFEQTHPSGASAVAYNMPYPSGILQGSGTSNDHTLELFGDINDDGTIRYIVYSLYAPAGAPSVTISGVQYTLYTLYRSSTPLTFASGATNNPAYPVVQNVLYNTTTQKGPSGQPIFSFPNNATVSIVPNTVTVVGTVVINLCIAVNPESLETGVLQWYTMSTQIRPLNLASAVNIVQNSGGARYLPMQPPGLPMANPSNYYQ